jgi:hypothetical protein
MKRAFKDINFRKATLALIERADQALDEYRAQGLRVTLRQLYYHFIANDLFPSDWIDASYNAKNGLPPDTKNTVKNYKSFGNIISEARLAGLLDWDAIEDRGRQPKQASEFADLPELIQAAISSYRLPRWKTQETYAELWVEKDALAGVLEPLTREVHATLMVNKGYSSQSAMFEAAKRFMARSNQDPGGDGYDRDDSYDPDLPTKECVLFYLGDHDPSGMDMVRDIQERLALFGADVQVVKIGLTIEQIRQYKCPPNPAKVNDPRAAKYIAEFGRESWEVDALEVKVLRAIVRSAFASVIDKKAMAAIIEQEEEDKAKLLDLAAAEAKR